MAGEFTGLGHPVWSAPSGYLWGAPDSSAAIARRRATVERINGRTKLPGMHSRSLSTQARADYQSGQKSGASDILQAHLDDMTWIVGTPDQAIDRLRRIVEQTRPGILGFYATDGKISHKDNMRNIELIGKYVVPALHEMGEELGLKSPFEVDVPISLALTPPEELRPYEYSMEEDPAIAGV